MHNISYSTTVVGGELLLILFRFFELFICANTYDNMNNIQLCIHITYDAFFILLVRMHTVVVTL